MAVRTEAAKRPDGSTLLARARSATARRYAYLAAAVSVLLGFVLLHTVRLAATPGMDPQEGYNLDFAWNLAHGRYQLFALSYGFAQHPPLFFLQLIAAIHFFGYDPLAIRSLAAMYAVLTCAALMLVSWRLAGPRVALWVSAVFTIMPLALANMRWGYTYAQLMFVGVLCFGAAWEYYQRGGQRWLVITALLAGLATASDYEGVAWIVFVVLLALRADGTRSAIRSALLACAIPVVSVAVSIIVTPAATRMDWVDTFFRASSTNPLLAVIELFVNYFHFLSADPWIILGIAGFFLIEGSRARTFVASAVAVLALVVIKVRPVGASFHSAVPLLPFLALGAGVALDRGLRTLYAGILAWWQNVRPGASWVRLGNMLAALVVAIVIVAPVGIATASDVVGISTSLSTPQDSILGSPRDVGGVAHYIQRHARPGDLILASPEVAWMFDQSAKPLPATRSADVLQTVAMTGKAASFYPAGLPRSRFTYSVGLSSARYVVVDNLIRQLAAPDGVAGLVPVLREVRGWNRVYASGQYVLYERPAA